MDIDLSVYIPAAAVQGALGSATIALVAVVGIAFLAAFAGAMMSLGGNSGDFGKAFGMGLLYIVLPATVIGGVIGWLGAAWYVGVLANLCFYALLFRTGNRKHRYPR
ncbi:MAG TPA: hypothetical protein PKV96_02060 [Candidatus Saccharimonas sp.]|nr:hypothetical protein [Candidatus Saccharimonas sp.]